MNNLTGYMELERKIGYTFRDQALLRQALTHSSFSNEEKQCKVEDYERLEFLGDAVLELAVSEHLYTEQPNMYEGNMTKTRASLVCESTLAICARNIKLEEYILLGKGEDLTGGRHRDSIVSDVFEAVIGAIYLDGGFEEARKYVHQFVLTDIEDKILFYDSKTILQERIQQKGGKLTYELLEEIGPAHERTYRVQAMVDGIKVSEGMGRTKKSAEQQAAYNVLTTLNDK
ncbi:MAG TPA: ribonuclease III [Lachnospiraceae bacterium]|jgi:ribonuclease III|nr:ribonuclease III [Lachnospiraceae bacterium]